MANEEFKMGATFRPLYLGGQNRTAKTYDLIFTAENGTEKVFNHFLSYPLAKKVLIALSKIENKEILDHFEEKLAKSMLNRKDRR